MHIFKKLSVASVLATTMSLSMLSHAVVITDTETLNEYLWWGEAPHSWTHDITQADEGSASFDLGVESVLSGSLTIELRDDLYDEYDYNGVDDSHFWELEFANVYVQDIDNLFAIEDDVYFYDVQFNGDDWTGDIGLTALIKLNTLGILEVTVNAFVGDFWILDSILTVVTNGNGIYPSSTANMNANLPASGVPAPASIGLFSLGLVGMGLYRRRTKT